MQSTNERIAANIRAEMARKNLSQRALATALGWSTTTAWRRLRRGTQFTAEEVTAAASFLGLSPTDLLGGVQNGDAA